MSLPSEDLNTIPASLAVLRISRLTAERLDTFVMAELVLPLHTPDGLLFRPVDLARLQLLCDLVDHLALEGEGLAVVVSLLDQLHAARSDLAALALAVQTEDADARRRIGANAVARGFWRQ